MLKKIKPIQYILIICLSLFLLFQTHTPLHSIDKNNIVKMHVSSYNMIINYQYEVLEKEKAIELFTQMKSGLHLQFFEIPGIGGAYEYRIELFYEENNETKSIIIFYNNRRFIIPRCTIDGKNYFFFKISNQFIEHYLDS